jgi:hypothetical protein
VLGIEALDFVQLDLGLLGPIGGSAGNPPLSPGQACGQVCASPRIIVLRRPVPLGRDLAVGRLPEPDRAWVAAKHNGVVPAPYRHGRKARCLSDGYQMTRRYPRPARRRELRRVPDGDNLTAGQDLAGIFLSTEHDAAAEPRGNRSTWSPSSHPSSMPGSGAAVPGRSARTYAHAIVLSASPDPADPGTAMNQSKSSWSTAADLGDTGSSG